MRLRVIAFDRQRPAVTGFRLLQPLQIIEDDTQIVMRLCKIRLARQRPAATGFCLLPAAQSIEDVAQIVMCLSVHRQQCCRLLHRLQGFENTSS